MKAMKESILTENFIDHEVRLRMNELINKQLNRKLNIIMTACGAIFATILIPIILHSLKLV
jgi:hypothetical protein